jgi:hypothetical protein
MLREPIPQRELCGPGGVEGRVVEVGWVCVGAGCEEGGGGGVCGIEDVGAVKTCYGRCCEVEKPIRGKRTYENFMPA